MLKHEYYFASIRTECNTARTFHGLHLWFEVPAFTEALKGKMLRSSKGWSRNNLAHTRILIAFGCIIPDTQSFGPERSSGVLKILLHNMTKQHTERHQNKRFNIILRAIGAERTPTSFWYWQSESTSIYYGHQAGPSATPGRRSCIGALYVAVTEYVTCETKRSFFLASALLACLFQRLSLESGSLSSVLEL